MSELPNGTPGWIDLGAHDAQAAKKWYGDLFGWTAEDMDTKGGPPYTMFKQGEHQVAGLAELNAEMKKAGVPPMWNTYFHVDDIKDVEGKVREFGGKVTVPVTEAGEHGSLAFFLDPEGGSFAAWQPKQSKGSGFYNKPVSFTWSELYTRDVAKAKDFYNKVFGWEFGEMPMGDMTYTMFKTAGKDVGGIFPMDAKFEGVPPHWMVYFAVEDADDIVDKVKASGGQIRVPATDIPVGRFATVADAQGAGFSVIALANPPE